MRHLAMAAVAVLVLVGPAWAGEKVELGQLPKPVADAVAKRFPKAEVKSAAKDGTGDKTVYEVTLKEGGKNIDVSLTAAGAITQIEQEVAFKDMPKAVAATFEKKYPKATYKIIEAVITVKDGKETLEYYEAVLVTAEKKTFEAEVLPDGKFKGEKEKAEKPLARLCGEDKKGDEKKGKKNDEKGDKNEKGTKKKEDDEKGETGAALPKAVAGAVKEKFPGGKVVGASKEGKGEKATYEVELRYKAATLEVVLTAKGEVVEVEVKGKKNEDEDEKGKNNKGKKDDSNEKGKKKGDDKKGENKQSGFEGEQKGQHEDKDDKKGEDKKKGKKKGEDDKGEKGKNNKGEKDRD